MARLGIRSSLILFCILAVTDSQSTRLPWQYEQVYQPDINTAAEVTENNIPKTDSITIVNEELYQFVSLAEYDKAVKLSISLFKLEGCKLLKNVINELLKNKNDRIMRYAYELARAEDSKVIVKYCFPSAFSSIFLGKSARINTKSKSGQLVLSTDVDNMNDRKLLIECKNRLYGDLMWQFHNEIVDNEKDIVYHRIKNVEYDMTLKLCMYPEENTQNRMVWADKRPHDIFVNSNDDRFKWRLWPRGLSADSYPIFCITNKYYGHSMETSSCDSGQQHVKGVFQACGPDSDWIVGPFD